jgi:hypothetical protein
MKIGAHEEARAAFEAQLKNCSNTVISRKGAVAALEIVCARTRGYVESLEPGADLNEKVFMLVKQHCAEVHTIVVKALAGMREEVTITRGRALAVGDSIEVLNRMILSEEAKLAAAQRKEEEAKLCGVCQLETPVESDTVCARCNRYHKRYKRWPNETLLTKWKEKSAT